MIKSVINKIKSNIWMFICLIIGSLLITSVLACIPMYTMGTLRQMLAGEMKTYEREKGKPAGQMYFTGRIPSAYFGASRGKKALEFETEIIDGLDDTAVGIYNYYTQFFANDFKPDRTGKTFEYSTGWSINSLTGLEDNIEIVEGTLYENSGKEGVLEVLIEKSEFERNDNVELGKEYTLTSEDAVITVIPVGVFEVKDPESAFWYDNTDLFYEALFCTRDDFEGFFFTTENGEAFTGVNIYANLNFEGAGIDNLSTFITYYQKLYTDTKDLGIGRGSLTFNSVKLINSYLSKTTEMEMSLWVLNVPVIAMLAFYMIMVTTMIIEEDKNEISTFKSRGAKTSHIFLRYVIESGFISVFALVLGPLVGMLLAKTVGNATGFLEFNAREEMPIKLSGEAYLYAIIACLFFSALILLPALKATKGSIVNLKQSRARKSKKSFWEKWFLDFVCLGVAVGLFFIYKRTDGFNVDGTVDPVVYVISSLFILGCGLVFLRFYPYIVALIFKITKRLLPPSAYSAFVQVSRGGNDYRFLMLFLIMTISVGIYSSASARIINNNVENTVKFENVADVIIQPDFSEYSAYQYVDADGNPVGTTESIEVESDDGMIYDVWTTKTYVPESFRHFPIEDYQTNENVNYISRVEICEDVYTMDVERGYWHDGFSLMAFDPYEFGNIAWCGTSLNGRSMNEFINILELSPTAVVISSAAASKCHAEIGDTITIDINNSNQNDGEGWSQIQCFVAAIVDYWPGMGDGTSQQVVAGEGEYNFRWYEETGNAFILMNFEYLYSVRDTNTYQLYASLKDDCTKGIDDFTEKALESGLITDASQVVLYRPDIMEEQKSDSMLKGLNGSYSIGFVSTLTVSFVGFIIYWIMNVRKRKLQFGILRAMGLTKGRLTVMLVIEHILTTGVSVVMGIVIGALTVRVYTPLLKIAYSSSTLPLDIIFNRSDNMKIYVVVIAMLVVGIVVLATFINKLKINEAVKIGEE